MTKTHAFCSSWLILAAFAVHAHHSRAPFLLDETFEIEGTVTEVAWRSPHVYMEVLAVDPDGSETTWTYEGHSIAGLKRFGWTEDTIKAGDRVVVVANPNRDPERKFGLLDSVTRTDGETFYSFRIPESEGGNPRRRPLAGSTDHSGHWNRIGTLRQALVGGFGPPTGWPVTAAGQAQVDAFDADDNPSFDCESTGMPGLILSPYNASLDSRSGPHRHREGPVAADPDHPPRRLGAARGLRTEHTRLLGRPLRGRRDARRRDDGLQSYTLGPDARDRLERPETHYRALLARAGRLRQARLIHGRGSRLPHRARHPPGRLHTDPRTRVHGAALRPPRPRAATSSSSSLAIASVHTHCQPAANARGGVLRAA